MAAEVVVSFPAAPLSGSVLDLAGIDVNLAAKPLCQVVVNVMAGVGNDDLRQLLATDAPLVRTIPSSAEALKAALDGLLADLK
ncbi:hypothetical protein ITI46_07495 [Streptomyces oryzae]|uniref:Uncharacterized protein n=1 Tax=Streptomyces oryzae TaxID=1434886 RepID=A0ABS3X839_9ACTN|nr:hypothetical protein [Streptomyces oryzae]MBO8191535.1 hypothetical protein [Streptomyces oryzae]